MNDNAKKWVAALRDPDAKQTKGRLEDENGNCCLGVACRVYSGAFPDWPIEAGIDETMFGPHGDSGILPEEVRLWLDLDSQEGSFNQEDGLTDMNDGGKTFAEIADLIESEPEGLFA